MAEERFTLGYTDFQANAAEVFSELRQDSEFSDVTLACNDGPIIRAHKVVLAGCSPVFRNLFQQFNNPNPLIVMRGLRKSELENVINYAYTGKTEVEQSKLDSFLELAEELNLKGLTPVADLVEEIPSSNEETKKGEESKVDDGSDDRDENVPTDDENDSIPSDDENDSIPSDDENESIPSDDLNESMDIDNIELQENDLTTSAEDESSFKGSQRIEKECTLQKTNVELEEILNLVNSKIVKLQNSINDFACFICGKEYTSKNKSSLKNHIEAHPEVSDKISLICSFCDKMFFRTRRFITHTKSCVNK